MLVNTGIQEFRVKFIRKTPRTFAILYVKNSDGFVPYPGLTAHSKCNPVDKFDRYEGKRKALDKLLRIATETLHLTKQERIAFWESYYKLFGTKGG